MYTAKRTHVSPGFVCPAFHWSLDRSFHAAPLQIPAGSHEDDSTWPETLTTITALPTNKVKTQFLKLTHLFVTFKCKKGFILDYGIKKKQLYVAVQVFYFYCLCEVTASYWSKVRLQHYYKTHWAHSIKLAPTWVTLKSHFDAKMCTFCFNHSLPLCVPELRSGKVPVRILLKTGSARSSSSDAVSLSHQGTTPAIPQAPPGP